MADGDGSFWSKKDHPRLLYKNLIGGADENRTRVRKQIHPSFSGCRSCLTFPLPLLHDHSYSIGSS